MPPARQELGLGSLLAAYVIACLFLTVISVWLVQARARRVVRLPRPSILAPAPDPCARESVCGG